ATEVFSWVGSYTYSQNRWGDADSLPNGNRLGCFGTEIHPNTTIGARIVEVDNTGQIVWELNFPSNENYSWGMYRTERFLEEPLIKLETSNTEVTEGDTITIELSTWDTFRSRYRTNGTIEVYEGTTLLKKEIFKFNPYWQETSLSIDVSGLTVGSHGLDVMITNSDDIKASKDFTLVITTLSSDTTDTTGSSGSTSSTGRSTSFPIISILLGLPVFLAISNRKKK
ncbi:MAG: hypothetical protein ACXAC7_16175, partial [Candidatus Hodarchaeales archaeon]